jgi:hypothetical protein
MLMKSTALEWLALCLLHCVLGIRSTLTYRFFADLMMVITGKMIYIITLIFVCSKTYNNLSSFVDMVQGRCHMLA